MPQESPRTPGLLSFRLLCGLGEPQRGGLEGVGLVDSVYLWCERISREGKGNLEIETACKNPFPSRSCFQHEEG